MDETIKQLKKELAEKTLMLVTDYSGKNNEAFAKLSSEVNTLRMSLSVLDDNNYLGDVKGYLKALIKEIKIINKDIAIKKYVDKTSSRVEELKFKGSDYIDENGVEHSLIISILDTLK